MFYRRFAAFLCATILLASPLQPLRAADKAPAPPKKIASVEGITEYQLANGMRVLLFPDNSRPRVTIALTVFVGSRHEGYGETGMAHLLEHMLFKGTPMHPRVDKVLRDRGANYNGTTNVDRTNYYETLPASDENLEFGIRFEADRLINCFVRREDLVSEMTVVRNEFERGENSPQSVLYQKMIATAFEWHNYGKSTIGNRSDIERVPIENLKAFYKKHYQPDNAMLVVAGKFDEKKALGYIQKYCAVIPRPTRALSDTYTEEPPQDGERTVTLRRVGSNGLVGLTYHIPAGSHTDMAALQVLSRVLTASPYGRLYKALVDTKKATSVGAFAQGMYDPGLMVIMAETPDGTGLPAVRDEMTKVIAEVASKGVTEAEVKRAVRELLTERERQATNTSMLAVSLSNWAAQGDWRLYFLHRDRLEKVTEKEVQAVAAKYLTINNRTVGFFSPTKKPERVRIPGRPDVTELVKGYKGREAVAQGEAFDPTWENIGKRLRTTSLESGVKAAFLPIKTRGNTVRLQLNLRFGNEQNLLQYRTAIPFLGQLMERGTKKLSYTQLREELTRQRATLNINSRDGELSVDIQTKRENLIAVLDLLRQVLREPALKAEEFDVLKKQQLAELQQQLTDPTYLAANKVNRELAPWGKDNYRYVKTLEEEIAAVKSVTLEQIETLYRDFLNGQHGEVSVVGDFDSDTTTAGLDRALKAWIAGKPYARIKQLIAPGIKPGRYSIETPDKANATVRGGLAVRMRDDDDDYPALLMANYILGSGPGSRMWDRIREKEGLSYGVGTGYIASSQDASARFLFMAITNPANVAKVQKSALDEMEKLAKEGVTKDELTRAVAGYLQQARTGRSDEGRLAGALASDLESGKTPKQREELEKKLRALTPEAVQSAFRKYIDPKKLILAAAGDFAKKVGGK